jgi:PAS domain S-box-containing protein
VPLRDEQGKITGLVGVSRDITERKRAEAVLAQERNLLRTLIDNLPDYIFVKDAQSRFVLNNRAHLALLKAATQAEVVGKTDGDIFPSEIAARYYADEQAVLRSGEPLVNREESTVDPAGRVRWLLTTKVPLRDEQGKITGLVGVSRDITERKRAEETLRQSEEKSRILFEQAGDIILQLEMMPDGRPVIRDANSVTFRLLGFEREELIGQPVSFIEALPDAAKVVAKRRRNILSGMGNIFVARHRCKDGTIRDFECSVTEMQIGSKTFAISVERDITERKQIERQLQRTQRLESIGTLAGGIAHDLNNALAPIMMATELLRLEFPDMADRYLDIIRSSTKRGADLVKQLLTFAKGAEGERLLVQPKHLLKEMVKPISSTFPKNIELRTQHAKDLWTILGDATQLHQVLLNLCVNARDAMPEGGTLTLEAENQELDAAYASTVPEAKPGRHVVWRVTDTGTGIPPEVLDRIFDPFFTTKGPDKGTGLGLSTTLGIVKSHGGFIRVYSTPGQGSTFAVYLPAYGVGAKDIALLTKAETDFRGNGETILVVDDEAAILNALRAVLTKLNFKVLTAGDGAAALIQVAEQQTELRAVITDLHMPHMDGLSFVRVLKARVPRAGVLVVSGRLDERAVDEFKKLGVTALLEKPFTHEKLVEALKTILEK